MLLDLYKRGDADIPDFVCNSTQPRGDSLSPSCRTLLNWLLWAAASRSASFHSEHLPSETPFTLGAALYWEGCEGIQPPVEGAPPGQGGPTEGTWGLGGPVTCVL